MKILNYTAILATIFTILPHFAWSQQAKDQTLPDKGDAPKSYQIVNKKHGDLLRPKDANSSDGTPIVLYSSQPWKCLTWKLSPTEKSLFTVQNHFTGKTFTLASKDKGNGVIQVALPKDASKAIKWRFIKLDDGNFRIIDPKSENVLTAVKGENDEIRIALLPWEKKDEQKWELRQIDSTKLSM